MPAVLDQRIARIHRLGQKQKVQVFILMAQNSYEERVAGLVKGKRHLFDNVIRPDASEDVVGVSKQMLETLIEDLAVDGAVQTDVSPGADDTQPSDDEAGLTQLRPDIDETEVAEALAARTEADAEVHLALTGIQTHFADRIERILGSGGGLLVIMDRVEDEDEAALESLSSHVPVALLESRALQGLQRLGTASPIADSQLLYEPPADAAMPRNPFLQQAENTLRSAEVLLEQGCSAGVLELLSSAMLCAAAGLNNESQLPAIDEAAVWIYGTALPKGILTQDQANALSRAIALSRASDIPNDLVYQVLDDARQLNTSISAASDNGRQ